MAAGEWPLRFTERSRDEPLWVGTYDCRRQLLAEYGMTLAQASIMQTLAARPFL
jgi:hypothetical protein